MSNIASTSDSLRSPTIIWWATSLLLIVAILAGVLFFHSHAPGQSNLLPPCLFNQITGFYCTGCGITRAAWALSHGMIGRAISMNALAVAAIPVGLAIWIDEGLGRPENWRKITDIFRDARVWAGVVILFTLSRNIPLSPFSWLAPL